jgi:hypothetical protein
MTDDYGRVSEPGRLLMAPSAGVPVEMVYLLSRCSGIFLPDKIASPITMRF